MLTVSGLPKPASRARRASGLLLGVACALAAAGCAAAAAPIPDVDRADYQYSADGQSWGGPDMIPWDLTTVPVPGGAPNSTTFRLRAADDAPMTGEVYLGRWSVQDGSAWFRADVDGAPGEVFTLPEGAAGPGVLANEFSLPAGGEVVLTLSVGLPYAETAQAARIQPDWGIVLRETAGDGGGTSPIGGGSIGSGSLGPSAASPSARSATGSAPTFGSLGGPLIPGP